MLVSIAVLHLLALAPVAPPPEGALAQAGAAETPAPPADAAPPAAEAPPAEAPAPAAPAPAEAAPAPAPPATPPAAAPVPAPAPAPAAPSTSRPSRPRLSSLLGAESLGGSSAALAWAGWSSLGAAWAMGVTSQDDAGAFVDHDWAKSELRLGGLYRRALAATGGFDVAFRLGLALYVNLGSTYVYSENHSERGVDLSPGVVLSQRAGGGVFAISADGPLTVTTKYDTGLLFSPRLGLSYEAPLYPEVTLGARIGAGYRAGAGDAPLRTGRGELQFLVLAGYQLL